MMWPFDKDYIGDLKEKINDSKRFLIKNPQVLLILLLAMGL